VVLNGVLAGDTAIEASGPFVWSSAFTRQREMNAPSRLKSLCEKL
jgi:hypothetical protein